MRSHMYIYWDRKVVAFLINFIIFYGASHQVKYLDTIRKNLVSFENKTTADFCKVFI